MTHMTHMKLGHTKDAGQVSLPMRHMDDLRDLVKRIITTWDETLTFQRGKMQVTANYSAGTLQFRELQTGISDSTVAISSNNHGSIIIARMPNLWATVTNTTVILDGKEKERMWEVHDIPTHVVDELLKQAEDFGAIPKGWMEFDIRHGLTTVGWTVSDPADDPIF